MEFHPWELEATKPGERLSPWPWHLIQRLRIQDQICGRGPVCGSTRLTQQAHRVLRNAAPWFVDLYKHKPVGLHEPARASLRLHDLGNSGLVSWCPLKCEMAGASMDVVGETQLIRALVRPDVLNGRAHPDSNHQLRG